MRRIDFGFAFLAMFIAATASAQTPPFAVSRCDPEAVTFSNIRLPQAVLADGKSLAAGTYQVRITTERPAPAAGQSPTAEKSLARREPLSIGSPFRMLDRFAEEIDRVFDDFGLGRGWVAPRLGFGQPLIRRAEEWLPDIEMLQRNNELVIRAGLPGLAKDDVKVDVTEDAITIQGERKHEHEEEKAGVYRSERSYGGFYRSIPLPEGAMTDQAKAVFKDGVLEVTMPAPPESVKRGRRLEITESAAQKK